ncbi:MAG: hypothetical protein ACUVSL_13470 [Chloroflexus sp.]|uniref:hypothetical protein n=1 Tax=Chloroflexus sp. TaxID=1904827 RepID=UPI00404B4770
MMTRSHPNTLHSSLYRPTASAAIARQRLRQTLQRDRLTIAEQRLDQQLLNRLLEAEVPHSSSER